VPDPAGLAAVDLTNPQTWNRYAYVANSPLSNVDPLGLDGEHYPWDTTFCGGDPIACALGGWDVCVWAGLCSPGGSSGGSSGSGGSQPSQPPSNPPSSPPSKPVNFPNETLGIPNGMNVNFGGPLGAILPSAICGDMGPCNPVGSGFQSAAAGAAGGYVLCQIAEPCGAIADTILIGIAIGEAGYLGYQYFSKGGTQEVGHDYVRDMARAMPGDYCTNLKTIADNARKSGNSKLFNDAKATWKQDCRGK